MKGLTGFLAVIAPAEAARIDAITQASAALDRLLADGVLDGINGNRRAALERLASELRQAKHLPTISDAVLRAGSAA